jgi:hypothetical protein
MSSIPECSLHYRSGTVLGSEVDLDPIYNPTLHPRYEETSVVDPWHFGTDQNADPDPRIRTSV